MSPFIDRIRRLARLRNEVWQAQIIRPPQWFADENGRPRRPLMGVCVSTVSARLNTSNPHPPTDSPAEIILETLAAEGGAKALSGYRPQTLQVNDPALAEELRAELADLIDVEYAESLPAMRPILGQIQQVFAPNSPPDLSTQPSATFDRVQSFADAAISFFNGAPWKHLTDEDLIQIESPAAPDPKLQCAIVMGAAGMTFGLAFYESPQAHHEFHKGNDVRKFYRKHGGLWTIIFQNITGLPGVEADWWESERLPVANPKAYPLMKFQDADKSIIRRPGARELAFAEGVMRALGETTEADLENHRWSKTVATYEGQVEFRLSLPDMLAEYQPADPTPQQKARKLDRALTKLDEVDPNLEFKSVEEAQRYLSQHLQPILTEDRPPMNAQEEAEDLIDLAHGTFGRRRKQLIRRALQLDPDCVDAFLLQGAGGRTAQDALPHYEAALAAAERSLGSEPKAEARQFIASAPFRRYMKARLSLAENLRELKRYDEAIAHFRELLRLNPDDHQRVRLRLLGVLLQLDRPDDLQDLFSRFDGESSALWLYGRALDLFRREGDTNNARRVVIEALDANGMAVNYLTGKKEFSKPLPIGYTAGSEAEAINVGLELKDAWTATPNALHWLQEQRRKKRDRENRNR